MVDLFAGIGYFSLPYLIHAKAEFLHACEWNPAAVKALRKNMTANKIPESQYKIHEGDNREGVGPNLMSEYLNCNSYGI